MGPRPLAENMDQLARRLCAGDRRALARALSWVEDDSEAAERLQACLPPGGSAHRVGITGPGGAGKSTLVAALAQMLLNRDFRVGILAVDPSSTLSGGAFLGDRLRMQRLHGDERVFIRSLAARGERGAIAAALDGAADVLEAAGFDPILMETAGAGQGDVAIAARADTTVLVLAPGAGDEIQGLKAGVLEIADIVVINQADRDGAEGLEAAIQAALSLRSQSPPPVLRTVALGDEGIGPLADLLAERLRGGAGGPLGARRLARVRERLRSAVDRLRAGRFWAERGAGLEEVSREVASGRLPWREALERLLGGESRRG